MQLMLLLALMPTVFFAYVAATGCVVDVVVVVVADDAHVLTGESSSH